MRRKEFLKTAGILTGIGLTSNIGCDNKKEIESKTKTKPIMVSTWDSGKDVNEAGWEILSGGGKGLDAIEVAGNYIEDTQNCCVGLGGNPDREGIVTLDASIMDNNGNIGSVAALERIKHPISVARRVMEKTPHVLIVGEGAQQFAIEEGFPLEEQKLSEAASETYQTWLKNEKYTPKVNIENSVPNKLPNGDWNHDTMAMICIDNDSDMAGGVTTSGMGFKMRGRVGDSPIIGAGLYVDNQVGAATSSGLGEEVIKSVGSFMVVEYLRQGYNPEQACKLVIERIISKHKDKAKDIQVGFIALTNVGEVGAYAIQEGFTYFVKSESGNTRFEAPFVYAKKSKQ